MKPIRNRSGFGPGASSPNLEPPPARGTKRPVSPAGREASAPLQGLRSLRSAPQGADLRPRVALPVAKKPRAAAKPGPAGAKAGTPSAFSLASSKGSAPTRADQTSAEDRLREIRLTGKMWKQMNDGWDWLLRDYRTHCDPKASGPGLVRALLSEIECSQPQDMKLDVPNVQCFLVQLHEKLPQVRALAVGDGIQRRMTLAPSDDPAVLKKIAAQLAGQAQRAAATKGAGLDDGYSRLWRRRSNDPTLKQVLAAWRSGEGANQGGAYLVLDYLQGLTAQAQGEVADERYPEISRFKLSIPGMEGQVDLLCRLGDDGRIADLSVVPEGVQDVGHLVNKLKWSQAQGQIRTDAPATGERDYKGLVSTVTANLIQEFNAFCELQKKRNVKRPTGKAFFDHLKDLCDRAQGIVVNEDLDIRRYVVTPEGSEGAVTLLRQVDLRGIRALRVLRTPSDEPAAIKKMVQGWNIKAKRMTSHADGPAEPAGAVIPASGAGKPARLVEALQLLNILKQVVENKRLKRPLMHDVEKASGLPETVAWAWIKPDGTLKRQPITVSKLRGYAEWREELCGQLGKLGDRVELPGWLSTAELVNLLVAYKNDSGATAATLAKAIDKSSYSVSVVYNGEYFMLSNDRLRSLPDYTQHRGALKEALHDIGQVGRANSLPDPESPGEAFLRQLDEHGFLIRLVMNEMQRDASLEVEEATLRVTLSNDVMDLTRKLLAAGGAMRQLDQISAGPPDLDSEQLQALQLLLGRFDMKPSTNGMATRIVKAHGSRPAKVFILPELNKVEPSKLPRQRQLTILGAMYQDNQQLVAIPRSYRHEREKQVLRWLSTVVKEVLFPVRDAREIQAYWDAEEGTVWLASNDLTVNRRIAEFFEKTSLGEALEDASPKKAKPRTSRHLEKLRDRLGRVGEEGGMKEESARDLVLSAIRQGNITIPTTPIISKKTGVPVARHAERRIQEAFEEAHRKTGRKIDPRFMAGVMRPCGTCAKSLDLPPEAHRGAFWISQAGQDGHDIEKLIQENLDAGIGTTVSKTREGSLDLYANTDSESDAEEEDVGKQQQSGKRKAPGRGEPDAPRSGLHAPPGKRPASSRPSAAPGAPEGAVVMSKLGTREFTDAFLGRSESNPLAARAALMDRVLALLQAFNGRALHRSEAYESLDRVFDSIQAETGVDIARAVRIGVRAGLADLPRTAAEITVGARQQQVQALKVDTLDAWRLLGPLGVPLPRDIPLTPRQTEQMLPTSAAQASLIGQVQVRQALQALMDEGSRRFGDFMAQLETHPGAQPAPEDRIVLEEISRQSAMLRHSAAVLGWLPPQASPTHPFPPDAPWPEGDARAQAGQLFTRGSASGAGNICWFDTLAQLSLGQRRGLGGDIQVVTEFSRNLRQASDRLGLSDAGDQFDDVRGSMHLIARFLGVQVHAFRSEPDGGVGLHAAQSIGSPTDRPVYLRTDDTHFEPMWPNWA